MPQQTTFALMYVQDDLLVRWFNLEVKLTERFGKKPDMEAILFLIGLQETGLSSSNISKEQKQDLMHVAVCTLLQPSGYFEFEARDKDGWPHFKQIQEMPKLDIKEQENFLKDHILLYFEQSAF